LIEYTPENRIANIAPFCTPQPTHPPHPTCQPPRPTQEAAAASAPGSVLIINLLTETGLENLRRRAAERRAADLAAEGAGGGGSGSGKPKGSKATGGGGGALPAAAAPAGEASRSSSIATTKFAAAAAAVAGGGGVVADGGSSNNAQRAGPKLPPKGKAKQTKPQPPAAAGDGAVAAAVAAGGDAVAAAVAAAEPMQGSSLTDHFQWGCPDNVGAAGSFGYDEHGELNPRFAVSSMFCSQRFPVQSNPTKPISHAIQPKLQPPCIRHPPKLLYQQTQHPRSRCFCQVPVGRWCSARAGAPQPLRTAGCRRRACLLLPMLRRCRRSRRCSFWWR